MAIGAPRPCRRVGCGKLVTDRSGHCDTHRLVVFKQQKQTVTDDYKERNRFYQRVQWKRARAAQLAREPLCRECRKLSKLVAAEVVDHINPISTGIDPYDTDNLQSLCKSCHNRKTINESR